MKSITSGIIATLLSVICVGGMAFAKPSAYPVPPPYKNPVEGEFPLKASYIYYKDSPVTKQDLKWVEECGFNILSASAYADRFQHTIDSIQGLDLKLSFYVWEAYGDSAKTAKTINRFKDDPHIVLYSIRDEPLPEHFAHVKMMSDRFNRIDPTRMTFVNLLPKMKPNELKSPDYESYVGSYVKTVNPPLISFDIYPVRKSKGKVYVAENDLYPTLETIAKVARESHRPFWAYLNTSKHLFYPKQKREYIRFQIFTNLAYGAQGLSYYTYALPDFDREKGDYSDAPLDKEGNRTDVWYMVRDVNKEVKNLTKVFLGAEVLDVSHTGAVIPDQTHRLQSTPRPFNWIASDGNGIIVSHLKNGTDEYIVMVNRDIHNRQKVRFSLSDYVTRLTGDGKEKREKGSSVTLSPGGYAVYRL